MLLFTVNRERNVILPIKIALKGDGQNPISFCVLGGHSTPSIECRVNSNNVKYF